MRIYFVLVRKQRGLAGVDIKLIPYSLYRLTDLCFDHNSCCSPPQQTTLILKQIWKREKSLKFWCYLSAKWLARSLNVMLQWRHTEVCGPAAALAQECRAVIALQIYLLLLLQYNTCTVPPSQIYNYCDQT